MFCTYREVLLPGERPGPGIGLPHQLTKDVDAVVDDALEPRSWYRSESRDLQTLSCTRAAWSSNPSSHLKKSCIQTSYIISLFQERPMNA
jgi:hypothetical protein